MVIFSQQEFLITEQTENKNYCSNNLESNNKIYVAYCFGQMIASTYYIYVHCYLTKFTVGTEKAKRPE